MVKVFISQPMKGKTEDEILRARDKAIEEAVKLFNGPVQIIDSFLERRDTEVKHVPLSCLAESLALLADADAAYFIEGWKDARGCRIERRCCEEYGILAIDQ